MNQLEILVIIGDMDCNPKLTPIKRCLAFLQKRKGIGALRRIPPSGSATCHVPGRNIISYCRIPTILN
jgi:hypothetical protein